MGWYATLELLEKGLMMLVCREELQGGSHYKLNDIKDLSGLGKR